MIQSRSVARSLTTPPQAPWPLFLLQGTKRRSRHSSSAAEVCVRVRAPPAPKRAGEGVREKICNDKWQTDSQNGMTEETESSTLKKRKAI